MIASIVGWITGPIFNKLVGGFIDGYKAKLAAGNTTERIAAELAGRELQVQQREVEMQAEYKRALIGHWYEPANMAAYVFVLYLGKVVVWDTMLGMGSTPAIRGNVGEWMALIAAFLFGKRGVENVAVIVSSALKRK